MPKDIDPPPGQDQSIAAGRLWLRRYQRDGVPCPCCDQLVKLYKRKLNVAMACAIVLIDRYFRRWNAEEWLHVPTYLDESISDPRLAATVRGGDWAKLKFWGLIAPMPGERGDGSWRNGYYKITERGSEFARGRLRVPKYIYQYNQEGWICDDDPSTTNVREALGERFSYDELMEA